MSEQGKSLNRKNGTLRGVDAVVYDRDKEEYVETGVVGWRLTDGDFFIGVGEREDGYDAEIEISYKALRRMLNIAGG